jgi:hypothetical protein
VIRLNGRDAHVGCLVSHESLGAATAKAAALFLSAPASRLQQPSSGIRLRAWSGTRGFTNSLPRTLNCFGRKDLWMTQYDGLERKLLEPHLDKSAITRRLPRAIHCSFCCTDDPIPLYHLPRARRSCRPAPLLSQDTLVRIDGLYTLSFSLARSTVSLRSQLNRSLTGLSGKLGVAQLERILFEVSTLFGSFEFRDDITHIPVSLL